MNHYFINDPNDKNEYRNIDFCFLDKKISLVSDRNVFSNRRLDPGTFILMKVLASNDLKGSFLDLGCGYGPIGLTMKMVFPSLSVTLSDVNSRCIECTNINKDKYKLDCKTIVSDSFQNIEESFDIISLNSPISCGKEIIYKMYIGAKEHLNYNGCFYIVIRKDKGALSHMKYLSSLFQNVSVIYKEKGYYVILAK